MLFCIIITTLVVCHYVCAHFSLVTFATLQVFMYLFTQIYSVFIILFAKHFSSKLSPFFMSIHAFMHTALLYIYENIYIYLYVYKVCTMFFFLLQHQTLTPYVPRIYFMILFFSFSILLLLLSVIIRGCFWKETE